MGQDATPKSQAGSDKKKRSIKTWIILGLGLVVIAAVAAGVLMITTDHGPKAFNARDIGMASDSCEKRIIDDFDDRLISKHFDNLSSRYEATKRQYVIYYRVSSRTEENGVPTVIEQLAKCIVWERLGYVSNYELLEI